MTDFLMPSGWKSGVIASAMWLPFTCGPAMKVADEPEEAPATGRLGQEWRELRAATDWLAVGAGLQLTWPYVDGTDEIDPASEDMAAWLALFDMGVCLANIVTEPRFRVRPLKAERDAALGRDTMHLAPLWRYPICDPSLGLQAEAGTPALILPVASGSEDMRSSAGTEFAEVLSLTQMGEEAFAAEITDLVALPLKGGRPRSMTGYTVAVGPMRTNAGRLVVYGGARSWLDAYLGLVQQIAAETPPHLVEQLHMPFPEPEPSLLVEPRALEWRVTQWRCVIPPTATHIVCPDSRALAELIDGEMRKKERVRTLPIVCGPKEGRAA